MRHGDSLERLAAAVLDGGVIDWAGVEAQEDEDARPAIQELRHLEQLARVHRAHWGPGASVHRDCDPSSTDGAPAHRWAHLAVGELLGRGAFGEVYRAWDATLARDVALKLLPVPRGESGPELEASIVDEGRRLARIRHANVVTIYGAARVGDEIGLWMELVQGATLEQLLERRGRFSPRETVRIGVALCGAVAAVHAAGLLHRDIKAQNVIQDPDGRVVLMDLGASRDRADDDAAELTGTPLYLAPELFEGAAATVQSDIYSLGVLLYHLLTGGYPVEAGTVSSLRHAHASGVRVRLRRARPDVPPGVARVVDLATDPDPRRRFASAEAFAAALAAAESGRRRVLRQLAAVAAGGGVTAIAWTRARPAGRDGPRLAVLEFVTESAGDADRIFTSGLAQELHRNLNALDGLLLLAFGSTSSRAAGGSGVVATGRALEADFVLAGSASWSEATVHVEARLVRVDDGGVRWRQTYNRPRRDILSIQDDISRAIADELQLTLHLRRRHDIGPDVVYELLRARDLQSRRGADDMREAAALFEEIVAREPLYAPAWAGIATSLAAEARLRDVPYPPRIKVAAQRAIQLDERDADAQQAMGNLFAAAGKWQQADESFLHALEINPSFTFLYTELVLSSLLPQGRLDEALEYLEIARNRDPLSLDVRRVQALVQVEARRYDEAIATSRWVLDRDSTFPFAKLWLGRALALSGRAREALEHYGQDPATAAYRGYAHAVLGETAEAERLAEELVAEPHRQMLIYGGLRDKERAFQALRRVVEQNPWRAATWMIRPEVALLRDDPRFEIIQNQLGLPTRRQRTSWRLLDRFLAQWR